MTIAELTYPDADELIEETLPLVVAVAVLGLIGAIPYLLVRRLRGHRANRSPARLPAVQFVPGRSRWGAA